MSEAPWVRFREGLKQDFQRAMDKLAPLEDQSCHIFPYTLKVTLLFIGVGLLGLIVSHVSCIQSQGPAPPTTAGSDAITPYIPIIMISSPLITATVALIGVFWSSRLAEGQRRKDEQRKRRGLATMLLSELQLLYTILKDIRQSYFLKALHALTIEPFHTATYDQAGSDRLLFQPKTAQVLAQFYSSVSRLQIELNQFRDLSPEHRTADVAFQHAIVARTLYTAECIQEAMRQLRAEGGTWPRAYPSRTYPFYPEDLEALKFPPFPTEDG